MSIEFVMPSNHLIPCHPLLRPSIFPILCMRWPKYWSFSFNISPSNEHFRADFPQDALVGSPCSPRDSQESSPTPHSKASILPRSAFFTVQLSHPYMTTGKTIALTRQTFVGKVMSLLFNMLSRLVIAFLSRNKHLLISWLQSPSTAVLDPKKIK